MCNISELPAYFTETTNSKTTPSLHYRLQALMYPQNDTFLLFCYLTVANSDVFSYPSGMSISFLNEGLRKQ